MYLALQSIRLQEDIPRIMVNNIYYECPLSIAKKLAADQRTTELIMSKVRVHLLKSTACPQCIQVSERRAYGGRRYRHAPITQRLWRANRTCIERTNAFQFIQRVCFYSKFLDYCPRNIILTRNIPLIYILYTYYI